MNEYQRLQDLLTSTYEATDVDCRTALLLISEQAARAVREADRIGFDRGYNLGLSVNYRPKGML